MQGGILNTLFALLFAMLLVSIIWGLSLYFSEFGSQEGARHSKNIFMGGLTLLVLLMCIYAVVEWIRAAVGI